MVTMFEGTMAMRWVVVGQFSPRPDGRTIPLSGERFSDVLTRLRLRVELELPDRLGSAPSRAVVCEFTRVREFRPSDVVARVDVLQRIEEVAAALVRDRDPITVETACLRIEKLVGPGPLSMSLRGPGDASTPSDPPPAAAAPPSGGISLDEVFEAGPPAPAIKSGLDAFIGAIRSTRSATPTTSQRDADDRLRAAATIRSALGRTAKDVLDSEAVAVLERNWRGLRTLVGSTPGHDHLAVELIDVGPNERAAAIERCLERGLTERPDLLVIVDPIDDDALRRLAASLSEHRVVALVGIEPDRVGLQGETKLALGEVPEAWADLRAAQGMGWVAAATNDIALAYGDRNVFGNASWAVATMLAASLQRDHTFGSLVGGQGGIPSPAEHVTDAANDGSVMMPTRHIASVDVQRRASERGVVVVGADPSRAQLLLAAAPVVGDGATVSARVLEGRARRLFQYIGERLPPDATPAEIDQALASALAMLVPKAPRGTVRLEDVGARSVRVKLSDAVVGMALQFDLDL